MIHHRFPIFILLLFLFALLYSCDTGNPNTVASEHLQYKAVLGKADRRYQQQQYDSAFYYYNQAKLSAMKQDNSDRTVYALIRMSAIQQIQSDFSGSEATATEALDYFNSITVPLYPIIIYNTLGIAFKGQYDYANAIKYYNLSLKNTTDSLSRGILQNNIAVILLEEHKYRRAALLLEPLRNDKAIARDTLTYAKVLDNLGYARWKSQQPGALALLNQSLFHREQHANDFELVSSYLHLSEYYRLTQPILAKACLLKAYTCATRVNSIDDRMETLRTLIYSTSGEESNRYALTQLRLSDSIGKIRLAAKNQFAKIRYDDAKTREENTALVYQKARMTYLVILLLALVLILILFVFMLRYRRQARHEREKLEAVHHAETRISRKIHDELANDLYNTITFTETQDLNDLPKKEMLLKHLDSVYERARDISRENSEIETGTDFPLQLRNMLSDYSSLQQKVILHGIDGIPWDNLAREKKIILYRVLQELMVNMKKHSAASFVMLHFEPKDKNITIRYTDNGVGTDKNQLFSKNGLRNVENRIHAIGGTFTFDSEPQNGLRATITCPSEN